MISTAEIIQAKISNIDDPFPEVPATGTVGWRHIDQPRPCVENIRNAQRILHGRNNLLYATADELYRRGWDFEHVLKECKAINEKVFLRSLKASSVLSTVKSAIKRNYAHHCESEALQRFCIGADRCAWIKAARRESKYKQYNDEMFDKNWYSILRQPVREVYLLLIKIEKNLGIQPGATITRSQRQLAQDLRVRDKGTVSRAMKTLANHGLIEIFPPTELRSVNEQFGFATRYRRMIPIPMPGENQRRKK